MLRSIEGSVAPSEGGSSVDDIAERTAALGEVIDARVRAALAKKDVPPAEK